MKPPKPTPRPDKVSLWRYLKLFRKDLLSAQPQRLYRAWMAEFRTPFFRSYMINQPELVGTVLKKRPDDLSPFFDFVLCAKHASLLSYSLIVSASKIQGIDA